MNRPKMHPLEGTLLCHACLAQRRPQLLEYDLRCNWWTCKVHGPHLTEEALHLDVAAELRR